MGKIDNEIKEKAKNEFEEELNKDLIIKEKEEEEEITIESLANDAWYKAKENKPILKIFKKEDNIFTSTENGDKISIESDEEGNHKISYQDESEQELKLEGEKYALFEIKTQEEEGRRRKNKKRRGEKKKRRRRQN